MDKTALGSMLGRMVRLGLLREVPAKVLGTPEAGDLDHNC